MAIDQYLLFLSLVALIVVSPGPTFVLVMQTAASRGIAGGVAIVLGVSVSIAAHYAIALTGMSVILASSAWLYQAIKLLGAAYLIFLGAKALIAVRAPGPDLSIHSSRAPVGTKMADASRGFLANFLNPKPILFYVALFPQFIPPNGEGFYASALVMSASHLVLATAYYLLVVVGVASFRLWLTQPKIWAWLQGLSGTILVALGARILLSKQEVS